MTWYGENRSGRETRWAVGDIVRYGYGSTALMRIASVREMGEDARGIACSVRYYGEQFFGGAEGRYHGQCEEPSAEDRANWRLCHDDDDQWIRGAYIGATLP